MMWLGAAAIFIIGLVSCAKWGLDNVAQDVQSATASAEVVANKLVASGWKLDAFKDVSTPEYFQTLEAQGDAAFEKYKILGEPKLIGPCSLVGLRVDNGVGNATFNCPATLTNGSAKILFALFKPNGSGWKLSDLKLQL